MEFFRPFLPFEGKSQSRERPIPFFDPDSLGIKIIVPKLSGFRLSGSLYHVVPVSVVQNLSNLLSIEKVDFQALQICAVVVLFPQEITVGVVLFDDDFVKVLFLLSGSDDPRDLVVEREKPAPGSSNLGNKIPVCCRHGSLSLHR